MAPQTGHYTLIIPGSNNPAAQPGGSGYAVVSVGKAGNVRATGVLADGTKFSGSSVISKGGQWPFYVPLYGGQGSLLCWISFTNSPAEDLRGGLNWIKSSLPGTPYPDGFAITTPVTGSRYYVPALGSRVLNFASGQLILNNGVNVTNNVTLDLNNRVINLSSNYLSLTVFRTTGLFRGSVMNPANNQALTFNGVIGQKRNAGLGYYLNASKSGQVYFGP